MLEELDGLRVTVVVTVLPCAVVVTVVTEPCPATMTVVPSAGDSVIVVGLIVPVVTVLGVAVAIIVDVP